MAAGNRPRVEDTDKTRNLEVELSGELTLVEMEVLLAAAAADFGLEISHVTVLGRKRYPGNRHWHLKQLDGTKGCLDVTYWPAGELMWISMRNYEPAWVHDVGRRLAPLLEARLRGQGQIA